jgi:hypothetical protein
MHARNQITRVGERTLKVRKTSGEVSKSQRDSNQLFVHSDDHSFQKLVPTQHSTG